MKKALKYVGVGMGAILVIYIIWIAFIPMLIGERIVEREVIKHSPQYIISQRSALVKLYSQYVDSEGEVRIAIKSQICEIANNLPQREIPTNIQNLCN